MRERLPVVAGGEFLGYGYLNDETPVRSQPKKIPDAVLVTPIWRGIEEMFGGMEAIFESGRTSSESVTALSNGFSCVVEEAKTLLREVDTLRRERDEARKQLQTIGKKAFWASTRKR